MSGTGDEPDLWAAEYVIGFLDGEQRREFEAARARDPSLDAAALALGTAADAARDARGHRCRRRPSYGVGSSTRSARRRPARWRGCGAAWRCGG